MAAVYPDQCGANESMKVDGTDDSYFENCQVGIGTTSPNTLLEMVGDGAIEGLRITEGTDTKNRIGIYEDATDGGVLIFTSNGGQRYRGTIMAHDFLFKTYSGGWQDRAVIDVNGNVGIGTTSPGAKLEVKGDSATASTVKEALNITNDDQTPVEMFTVADAEDGSSNNATVFKSRDGELCVIPQLGGGNDSTAIQQAIDYLIGVSGDKGGTVYLPADTYTLTSEITIGEGQETAEKGTASGGSRTTLIHTGKDFGALGITNGAFIRQTSGAHKNDLGEVTNVSGDTLTFQDEEGTPDFTGGNIDYAVYNSASKNSGRGIQIIGAGANATVLVANLGSTDSNVFRIRGGQNGKDKRLSTEVVIKNLRIKMHDSNDNKHTAIYNYLGMYCIIENVKITGDQDGVYYFKYGIRNTCWMNRILNCSIYGCRGAGILLDTVDDPTGYTVGLIANVTLISGCAINRLGSAGIGVLIKGDTSKGYKVGAINIINSNIENWDSTGGGTWEGIGIKTEDDHVRSVLIQGNYFEKLDTCVEVNSPKTSLINNFYAHSTTNTFADFKKKDGNLNIGQHSSDSSTFSKPTFYSDLIIEEGNVGIGTSSPDQGLHVVDAGAITAKFESSDATHAMIELENKDGVDAFVGVSTDGLSLSGNSYNSDHVIVDSGGKVGIGTSSPNENLEVADSDGGRLIVSDGQGANRRVLLLEAPKSSQDYARILAWKYGTGETSKNLVLQSSGGNVGVGTTSPSEELDVDGTIRSSVLSGVGDRDVGADQSGDLIIYSSDKQLKKNIKTIKGALSKVIKLRGISFEWKVHTNMGKGKRYGLIAQEVQKIIPEIVSKSNTGLLTIRNNNLTALLLEAIKEQQVRIESLEKKLAKKNTKRGNR